MARYKTIDRNPRLIAISLDAQLLPGTFEHALDYLIDHEGFAGNRRALSE